MVLARVLRRRRMLVGTSHRPGNEVGYKSALFHTRGFVVEIEVRTSLSPTQDSAKFTRMLSCAHRLAAVTSFSARSLRFCCRWICTIRATASTVILYQR